MSDQPLVTVVIPTWNRRDMVCAAVQSVLQQTFRQWELVIVDDGSTDRSATAVSAFGDPRISIIAIDHCGNIGRLRNLGVAAGSAPLVAFLDSDDLWVPEKLELQLAALHRRRARWCYGNFAHIAVDGTRSNLGHTFRPDEGGILRSLLLEKTSACTPTLLLERDLFEELGGYAEDLPSSEDLDFLFRIATVADAAAVDAVLALVRVHPGRTTAGFERPHELTARVFERLAKRVAGGELARLAKRRWGCMLADAAGSLLRAGEVTEATALFREAAAAGAPMLYRWRRWLGGTLGRLRTGQRR